MTGFWSVVTSRSRADPWDLPAGMAAGSFYSLPIVKLKKWLIPSNAGLTATG